MDVEFLKDIDICSPEILALLFGSEVLIGIINSLAGRETVIGFAVFTAYLFDVHKIILSI